MNIPAGLIAAFIESGGGCKHTPEPWKGCSTCGRPIADWVKKLGRQVIDTSWQAITIDGEIIDKQEVLSLDNLPVDKREKINKLQILTDNPNIPFVNVTIDPRKRGFIHKFKRNAVRLGVGGVPEEKLTVLVVEIKEHIDSENYIRLYIHPNYGIILSTEDLYF